MRVVTLGLNRIDAPVHGGEQRSYWLNQILERHFVDQDYRTRAGCLGYFRPAKRKAQPWKDRLRAWRSRVPYGLLRDLGFHRAATMRLHAVLEDDVCRVESAQVVVFDQPFAYPFYKEHLEDKVVVYSSQNIESQILEDYYDRPVGSESERQMLLQRIDEAESELTARADLVICCTESDAEHYRRLGGSNVVVAPNGSMPTGSMLTRSCEETVGPGVPFSRYALMVSSSWTPNVAGLVAYCRDLALPDGYGLVCAGSIGRSGYPELEILRSNPSIAFTGPVDAGQLASLVVGASAIVVPMLAAGGSNVKMAEALLSDRTIIATPAAFRGYEAFENALGVRLAEAPEEFCKEIAMALELEPATWSRPEADRLRWPNALQPAEDALLDLIDG